MFVKSTGVVCQPEAIRKALAMLELMDRSAEDNLIISHVSLMLEDYDEEKTETEKLLYSLISLLLGSFATHLADNDILSTQIKLMQLRLTAPITQSENLALQHYVEICADLITQKDIVPTDVIGLTLEPLFKSFSLDNKKLLENVSKTVSENVGGNVSKSAYVKAEVSAAPFSEQKPEAVFKEKQIEKKFRFMMKNKSDNDTNGQNDWGTNVSDFGKSLKQLFSSNYLANSIEQSEKFGVLLEMELATLKNIDDADSFVSKKSHVLGELEKVLLSHQKMTREFQKMSEFMSVVQKDSVRLNDELDKATLLSLTDELTELPNRRAFLQRLNDEVGRVKRYGHHLSLALIDLDYFKPINDKYGHAVGDAVLEAYSSDILSGFREQDMVARFGGEEFVVIFPNTAIPGALQALNMVQERTNNAMLSANEVNIKLPTFSAGLISYIADESTDSFIGRADQALYDAKNKGRNRIEVKFLQEDITITND